MKAPSIAKWLESPSALRSGSLALGAGWGFQSGILGLLAPSPIERDNIFSADPSFAHWALLPLWPCLQPLMKTGPTVQVATHTDHSFPSSLQTNITFEGRARPSPLAVWPFGAPVLLLRCCHGRYSFVPRVPLSPLKHTYKRPEKRETSSGPRSLDRLQSFLITIGLSACQSYRIGRKDWSKRRGAERWLRGSALTQ